MQEPYSIIIPTSNEEEHIVACLQNVKTCLPNCEIIVVDGGSKDNTIRLVKQQVLT
jgi:glycosyltransferase involved in cell wall biosynthesis